MEYRRSQALAQILPLCYAQFYWEKREETYQRQRESVRRRAGRIGVILVELLAQHDARVPAARIVIVESSKAMEDQTSLLYPAELARIS